MTYSLGRSRPVSMGAGGWRVRIALLVATMVLGILVFGASNAPDAEATHFRANQITWEKTGPTEAAFVLTGSWRSSAFFATTPNVGDTFSPGCIDYGDGTSDCPQFEVTSTDAANDVLSGEAHTSHTYDDVGPYTASMSSCCRLSPPQHINNGDGSVLFSSLVDLSATTASPRSLVSPIVDCGLDTVCTFNVPAVDDDGQELRWRFATDVEASGFSGGFTQPSPPAAVHSASIDPTTGLYTWDTTGATLNDSGFGDTFYSTQVIIENVVGGNVVASIPVDFFIRLTVTPNQQPQFEAPTPADGTIIDAVVGSPVTFQTQASDPDEGDTVTVGMLGTPADATYTTESGNPATGTFEWTPTEAGEVILVLSAQDDAGLGATQRSLTIRVAEAPTCVEDGLDLAAPTGVASGTVHDAVEGAVGDVDDSLGTGLGLEDTVHQLNCDLVVPVEDFVDQAVAGVLGGL